MDSAKNDMRIISGIAVSPGIAVGRLRVVDRGSLTVDEYAVSPEALAMERQRLRNAIIRTRDELEALKTQLQESMGEEHLYFIDTHLLILTDERLYRETAENIETELINAE